LGWAADDRVRGWLVSGGVRRSGSLHSSTWEASGRGSRHVQGDLDEGPGRVSGEHLEDPAVLYTAEASAEAAPTDLDGGVRPGGDEANCDEGRRLASGGTACARDETDVGRHPGHGQRGRTRPIETSANRARELLDFAGDGAGRALHLHRF